MLFNVAFYQLVNIALRQRLFKQRYLNAFVCHYFFKYICHNTLCGFWCVMMIL